MPLAWTVQPSSSHSLTYSLPVAEVTIPINRLVTLYFCAATHSMSKWAEGACPSVHSPANYISKTIRATQIGGV
jgi:hypothetical protein